MTSPPNRLMGDQTDLEALTDACNELLRNMRNMVDCIKWYRLNKPTLFNPHEVNLSQVESYMAMDDPKSLMNTLAKWRAYRGVVSERDGQKDSLRLAAMAILLGVEPHGESESIIENWRIKQLAVELQPKKEGDGNG